VARKNVDLRELTDEEMVRAYDELEREMREMRNNLGKRGESSNTEIIRAWRTRTREAKESKSRDIEERALLLAVAADRIRERTYVGARVIEVAPARDTEADRQGIHAERVEAVAQPSNLDNEARGGTRRMKIQDVKTEPEDECRTNTSVKKVKREKMETSHDSEQSRRRGSGRRKNDNTTKGTSSTEERGSRDERKEKQKGSKEKSKKGKEECDSEGEEKRKKHRGKGQTQDGEETETRVRHRREQ